MHYNPRKISRIRKKRGKMKNKTCSQITLGKTEDYKVVIWRKEIHGMGFECYDFKVVAEYSPISIFEYLNSEKNSSYSRGELLENARKHLSAIGWTFWSKIKKCRDEWRYVSPENRTYYSMVTACTAIANGVEANTVENPSGFQDFGVEVGLGDDEHCSDDGFGVRKQKRAKIWFRDQEFGDESKDHCSNGLKFRIITKKKDVLGDSNRVVRSSRRVPRTVLSWLIENNAVVPRSKVYYCKGGNAEPMAEGRIVRDGIRCGCCQNLFSLSGFQAHVVGSNIYRPAENIVFVNGKSLVSCQAELMRKRVGDLKLCRESVRLGRDEESRNETCNDSVCSICHYGGNLILCDRCPSSFHADCLNLPGVPEGDWFCPSCCCGVCGTSRVDDDRLLCCHQCERLYHAHCKKGEDMDNPEGNWFCCITCEKMHWGLQQLLGKPILVGQNNLTWTLFKPMQYEEAEDHEDNDLVAMTDNYSKLSVALEVMHECFEPVKDVHTKRDLVESVLFCRRSNLNRLNFTGFYTVLLERNDELIAVALLRIYGVKVAEIPLIGTRVQHRRNGMCRILMSETEKTLLNLEVKKLVLPAAASVLNTWTTSFGFSQVTESDRLEFLGYTFLEFQGTVMCQKLLRKIPSSRTHLSRNIFGVHHQPRRNVEGSNNNREGTSCITEVLQENQRQGSDVVDQGAQGNNAPSPCRLLYSNLQSVDHKKIERDKIYRSLKFYYKRKNHEHVKPSVPQPSYSKVVVSCI